MYRHGARNPLFPYPTDPYSDPSNWPEGWGELNTIGERQMYELGLFLRARYDHILLSEHYSNDEILIQAANVSRVIKSSEANLRGIYQYSLDQAKQIPLYILPESEDFTTVALIANCPFYENEVTKLLSSNEFDGILKDNKDLLDYIALHTYLPVNSTQFITALQNSVMLRDTLLVEELSDKV